MNVSEWAAKILLGEQIEDKLLSPENIEFDRCDKKEKIPPAPSRHASISFSSERIKFPKVANLHETEKRIIALHSFANHELMAIEIFASFFLLFPIEDDKFIPYQKHLVQTLKEEQLHFSLYKAHIEKLGGHFGDYPLNDFFWRVAQGATTPEQFFAIVSLSLETANLDFSKYYSQVFDSIEDHQAAEIMRRIYIDEIKHVSLGRRYIEKNLHNEESLWEKYQELLPIHFSPARSKGIIFDMGGRRKAGLTEEFIQSAKNYRSEFDIVNRKAWK